MDAEYKIVAQEGERGFYADIALSIIEQSTGTENTIDFGPECDADWRGGVQFGVEYAIEKLPSARLPHGVKVMVTRLRGHDVDTTLALVALATMNAVWRALGVRPIQEPGLDKAQALVLLPK